MEICIPFPVGSYSDLMLLWGQDRHAFLCLGGVDYHAASSCEHKEPLIQLSA